MLTGLKRIVVAMAVVIGAGTLTARAQHELTAGAKWVNELGSVLTIEKLGSDGLLSGTYVSKVGCGAGKAQPMTGWFYPGKTGGAITFAVNWQTCDSVTTWLGQFDYSTGNILTLWYLSLAAKPAWNGINAGSDIFRPQK